MNSKLTLIAVAALSAGAALGATAMYSQNTKDSHKKHDKPAAAPTGKEGSFPLPPGMTQEDMDKCMASATPGPNQAFLNEGEGHWSGTCTMWMTPEAKPMESECSSRLSPMMDGRYSKVEWKGDMGGMPFTGLGYYGFDNVSKQFQCVWLDNCGTGISFGTGELSADRKTMTWTMTFNCPITGKPTKMREVERIVDANTRTFEMYSTFPKTGQEFKTMECKLTRKGGVATTAKPAE